MDSEDLFADTPELASQADGASQPTSVANGHAHTNGHDAINNTSSSSSPQLNGDNTNGHHDDGSADANEVDDDATQMHGIDVLGAEEEIADEIACGQFDDDEEEAAAALAAAQAADEMSIEFELDGEEVNGIMEPMANGHHDQQAATAAEDATDEDGADEDEDVDEQLFEGGDDDDDDDAAEVSTNNAAAAAAKAVAKEPHHTQLPLSRIKALMKMNPDTGLAGSEAVFLMCKATELFIESLTRESFVYTAEARKKTVQLRDVQRAIDSVDALMFLEGALV